ncbi:hypothetical protein LUZ60_003529 [Juncus effusus]|nr:hypothetical protein LUZ60_003529 [Juncus effusus]
MRPAQDLFFFNSLSPGSCFLLPDGKRVFDKLMEFIKAEYWKRGYDEVGTSMMYNMQLWETSNYKEKMFMLEVENQKFGLKPMNGPDHCLVFNQRKRSYRELPLRYADFGVLHKNEPSGELSGLPNIRKFQEDDALIFCRESQVKDEVKAVLDFIDYVYKIFGFTYELELSTRPDKYVGEIETWNKAESALSDALNEFGKPWKINEGGGAYHGPKIDIGLLDSLQRKFQCATLQLDFELPLIFKLSYSTEDESKFDRPVLIHRAVLGSLERIFENLLKNYKGKWPLWLSPRQVIVCSDSSVTSDYAIKVWEEIHEAGFDVDIDESDRAVEKKVEEAQLAKYNYILVVGEKEADAGKVCVRVRDEAEPQEMSLDDLINKFKSEVEAFK